MIGEHAKVKKEIEKRTKTKIDIGGTDITIEGDSFGEWIAKDVVKAIGRGFNPEKAFMLFNDANSLEVISISEHTSSKKSVIRIKSRLIGREGNTRKKMEEITGCYLSIYGKTVAIIGPYEDAALTKEVVVMLINGASHSYAYRFLEKGHRRLSERKN